LPASLALQQKVARAHVAAARIAVKSVSIQ